MLSWLKADIKRLGLVVSARVGGSVQRNRLKRLIREHFRTNRHMYPNGDVVIIARSGIVSLNNKELRVALADLLNRVGGS